MTKRCTLYCILVLFFLHLSCALGSSSRSLSSSDKRNDHEIQKAICKLKGTTKYPNITGTITFVQYKEQDEVRIDHLISIDINNAISIDTLISILVHFGFKVVSYCRY